MASETLHTRMCVVDYRRYTVFCLVRIGTELHDTNLVTEVDRLMTDISFDDIITM